MIVATLGGCPDLLYITCCPTLNLRDEVDDAVEDEVEDAVEDEVEDAVEDFEEGDGADVDKVGPS